MAANFGPEGTQAVDLATSVTAKQGIVKSPALAGASDVFDQITTVLKGRKESKKAAVVNAFTAKQLSVAHALDQNPRMTKAHAQTLFRKNLIEAYEGNPELLGDFVASQKSILGVEGAAKIVATGSEEEQRANAARHAAVSNNLVRPDATDAEVDVALQTARTAADAQARYKSETSAIDLELKQNTLTKSRREELEAQKKQAADSFISATFEGEFTLLNNQFTEILEGEGSETDKRLAIDTVYNEWQAKVMGVLGQAESGKRTVLEGTFEALRENYRNRASGEMALEELERKNKEQLSKARALALSDPLIANMAITNELFGRDGFTKIITKAGGPVTQRFLDFMAGTSPSSTMDPPSLITNDSITQKATIPYLNFLSESIQSNDPDASAAATEQLAEILNGVEDSAGQLARDPKRAIRVVDWFASASFLNAYRKDPDAFNNLDSISSILDQHYHDEVMGLVDREFRSANVIVRPEGSPKFGEAVKPGDIQHPVPASALVEAISTDSGVSFKALNPKDRKAVAVAARLNTKLKPIINNMVKAQAHLNGQTNYREVWEGASEAILGTQSGGDSDDDLNLSDFNGGVPDVPEPQGFAQDEEKIIRGESGGDPDALFGFVNRSGSEFDNVQVSKMTIDELIEFSSPSGPYGQSVKKKIGRVATPMGLYQIVGTTLKSAAKSLGLSGDEVFTPELQRALAKHIYAKQGRGAWEALK